jgi:hypothetical protein
MVTVFIWNFRGKDVARGRASLLVDRTYMSWWPEGSNGIASKLSDRLYSVHPIRHRLLSDDIAAERYQPDHLIDIAGLDESKIRDWWQSFGLAQAGVPHEDPMLPWETLARNCSTVAARGLSVGGGDRYANSTKPWNSVWTPHDVLQYATSIRAGLSAARK